jgi:hypothetical protein
MNPTIRNKLVEGEDPSRMHRYTTDIDQAHMFATGQAAGAMKIRRSSEEQIEEEIVNVIAHIELEIDTSKKKRRR